MISLGVAGFLFALLEPPIKPTQPLLDARSIPMEKERRTEEQQKVFDLMAHAVCGENAGWDEYQHGRVRCLMKTGRKTGKVVILLGG